MTKQTCPMSALEVLDAGFIEARARIIEVAALLDRVERAGEPDKAKADFRYQALRSAIGVLVGEEGEKAWRVLLGLSDPTSEPIEKAPSKGAVGAWPGLAATAEKGGAR